MTAAQFERLGEAEAENILRWRFRMLSDAGYDACAAARLASAVEIDLHQACDLVANGCSPVTALRILL
jgi:predicted Zn-dependent protease